MDLYASGEQRSYGPLFLQRKMNISNQAFSEGDFSLTIADLQVCIKECVHVLQANIVTCVCHVCIEFLKHMVFSSVLAAVKSNFIAPS